MPHLDMTNRIPVRVGEVLVSFDGYLIVPADPADGKQRPIGIALEAIPEGTIIEWDIAKREGCINGRRVIAGVMNPDDVVHIMKKA